MLSFWLTNALFPVLMTLLLFMGMMPKPGLSLSCMKCEGGSDCDKPDTSKECTGDEKSCFTYGKLGSGMVSRGCAPEAEVKCVKDLIGNGQKGCYSAKYGPDDTTTKVEECLKGVPPIRTLGEGKEICYCEANNCNSLTDVKAIGIGTPMKKIKCYDCTGKPGSDCAVGNMEKAKKTIVCEGVCVKYSSKDRYSVQRTCDDKVSVERFKCLKEAYGEKLCRAEGGEIQAEVAKNMKYLECWRAFINASMIQYQRSYEGISQDAMCVCDSDLCNQANHLSPNEMVLIFTFVAITFIFFLFRTQLIASDIPQFLNSP